MKVEILTAGNARHTGKTEEKMAFQKDGPESGPSFAPTSALGPAADTGPVAMVIPVLLRQDQPLRLRNFRFLLQQYSACKGLDLIIVEQMSPDAASLVEEEIRSTGVKEVTHLRVELASPLIHKSLLVNQGSRHARDRLNARYIWQMDADILVPPDLVLRQLSILNSETIPIIKPFLGFDRLSESATQEVLNNRKSGLDDWSGNLFQVIDYFGPGSVIFSCAALKETGGMDERYIGWGWEDMDFGKRLSQRFPVHTLPLRGVHLNHEQDRTSTNINFENYVSDHLRGFDELELRHLRSNTAFNNTLNKFCVIADSAEYGREALMECRSVLSTSGYLGDLTEPFLSEDFVQPVIKALGQSSQRRTGFLASLESFRRAGDQALFRLRDLAEFLVAAGFRVLVLPSNGTHPEFRGIFLRTLERYAGSYHNRVEDVSREIPSLPLGNDDSSLKWAVYLEENPMLQGSEVLSNSSNR